MLAFILKRFLFSVVAILAVSFLLFVLSSQLADPRYLFLGSGESGYGLSTEAWEKLGRDLRLDRPVVVRYVYWIGQLARGDLGTDFEDGIPISRKIRQKLPVTAKLAVTSWLLATVVGIPLGVISAVKRGTLIDLLVRGFAIVAQAAPNFWLALMGMFVFAVWLHWLPVATPGEGFAIRNYILPAVAMAHFAAAAYARLTRSAMLEVLDSEYVKLARAKGVSQWTIIWKHAFRNALIPPLTYSGLLFASFLHGTIVIEVIFGWPGVARLSAEAVWNNNFSVLLPLVVMFSGFAIVMNFLVDVAYAYIDPRIG